MYATIIILTYNQEKTVKDSLISALHQNYDNFTVIICDDGSTDSTQYIIKKTIEEFTKKNVKIIYLTSLSNQGIIYNFNKSIPFIEGDFFITQAGDDISAPNRLLVSAKVFSNNSITAYFSATKDIDINNVQINTNYAYRIHQRNTKLGGINLSSCVYDEAGILGASAGYRTDVILNTPLPNVTFSEDKLLTLRAASIGKVIYTPEKLVSYRIGSGVTIKTQKGSYLKSMSKLMYRRNKFLKSISRDIYLKNKIAHLKNYNEKIITLRVSSVLSYKLLKNKLSIFMFLCKIIQSSLYNKITLRAIYYLIKSKIDVR